MKTKLLSITLFLALCLGLLAGCGGEKPDAGPTGSVAGAESTGDWDCNITEHWKVSASGEKTDVGEHELNGNSVCTVCGNEVWTNEDGTVHVYIYNIGGDLTRVIFYDTDGTVSSESYYEYADGAEGRYTARSTDVDSDGCKYIMEHNEQGDATLWQEYDADGNLILDEAYEWTYDEEGHWQSQKIYVSGTLTQETVFMLLEDEEGWLTQPETITDYFEDGSKSVTTYDENGDTVSVITYDAAGNEIAAG